MRLKKLFLNVRIIILIVFLLLAVVAIRPDPFREGVAIRSVVKNSAAAVAGIENPKPTTSPVSRELILAINNQPMKTLEEYYQVTANLSVNQTLQIKTNRGFYTLTVLPQIRRIELNETEERLVEETIQVNETINGTIVPINKTVQRMETVPKIREEVLGLANIGLNVQEAPTNNIRKGLDLQGGTRVLLAPEKPLEKQEMDFLLENMGLRLNNYGLSDILLRETKDLAGNQFVLVEIAGANEEEVKDLLAKQGKFEARIGNETVFIGGRDITWVCKSGDCAGIDPQYGCADSGGQWVCRFRFAISVAPEAAARQAAITQNLEVITEGGEPYLSQDLRLFLDDQEVDTLNIAAELKGRPVTDIAISGSGLGATQDAAIIDALQNMKKLQTVLITGSLPVKLGIVKMDSISPALGEEFTKNMLLTAAIALLGVSFAIYLYHRRFTVAISIIFTLFAEILLILGLAALIGWNLDLAAIAGIIITIGTGTNDQIVITDEILRGETSASRSWKERIKKAFFIIFAAYSTNLVAMLPLLFSGAGLLKGFALTTIAGMTFGVLITRPAYAVVMQAFLGGEE
ncbi:hypothetical protein HYS48_04665 [Candidatus Woesearchaeota archaeon]|nr:hypothetical protein [Candidatus Woesearchaeota archaeon]